MACKRQRHSQILRSLHHIVTEREREFLLVDLMSSVNVEKVRGFVEDGAKFLYTSDDITISLLPYLITGVILLLGRNLRRLHSSKCSV